MKYATALYIASLVILLTLLVILRNVPMGEFIAEATDAIVTLTAIYLGAVFAFIFQNEGTKKREKEAQIAAGDIALFHLEYMLNEIENYKHNTLAKYEKDPYAFYNMPPNEAKIDDSHVDINTLSFLIPKGGKDIIGVISVCVGNYRSWVGAINRRSSIYIEKVRSTAEETGISVCNDSNVSQIEKHLGQQVCKDLVQKTRYIIDKYKIVGGEIESVRIALSKAMKDTFPNKKFDY